MRAAAEELKLQYGRNFFPYMKVSWKAYPEQYRAHDGHGMLPLPRREACQPGREGHLERLQFVSHDPVSGSRAGCRRRIPPRARRSCIPRTSATPGKRPIATIVTPASEGPVLPHLLPRKASRHDETSHRRSDAACSHGRSPSPRPARRAGASSPPRTRGNSLTPWGPRPPTCARSRWRSCRWPRAISRSTRTCRAP